MPVERVRVRIDQDECVSTGRCVADAPGVFRFDPDELSEVIDGTEWSLDEAAAMRIARNCPNRAIIVECQDGSVIDLG